MKHVLLLSTGGTIASMPGKGGLEPAISGEALLNRLGDLHGRFHVEVKQILNLDSSNIQAEEWKLMARTVYENLEKYDGFIITHGTDTMAYSASMLSFMLPALHKPVVFTGSQIPLDDMLTDARNNLFCALAAVEAGICGVSVAFNRHIIRGCRAVKVRTMGFDAFESVNARYLGEIFANGLRVYDRQEPREDRLRGLMDSVSTDVFLLKLIPNTNPKFFDHLIQMGYRGIVLEAFGAGGMHFHRRDLVEKLNMLKDHGIVMVACSQCLYEPSNLTIYEVGRKLLDCGVIPAGDMTTEAAVTKLMWALGQTDDPEEVRKIFSHNFTGEISEQTIEGASQ
ncbi:MAG: asparaginase [Oscillospiraceae bacterium]|nr:asparaginase [Oscillospiraceae bacterium]